MSVIDVKNRIPTNVLSNDAVRYGVYDEEGKLLRYEYMKREDEPLEEGTPINKLLFDNFQGDLYTQDRYNATEVSYEEVDIEVPIKGDIIPKVWTQVIEGTEYVAEDGTILRASSYNSPATSYGIDRACDGSFYNNWLSSASTRSEAHLIFPTPKKITKFLLKLGATKFSSFKIYGRKEVNGNNITLYESTTALTQITEITLNNADYYIMYSIYIWGTDSTSKQQIYEWQVSEYIGYEGYVHHLDLPLTSYEKGKIVNIEGGRIPSNNIIHNTDIIPKTWTGDEYTYTSSNGTEISCSEYDVNHMVYKASDGDDDTFWEASLGIPRDKWIKLNFPQSVKITKMKMRMENSYSVFTSAKLQGSNDDNLWVDLYDFTNTEISYNINWVEFTLNNADYYKQYRIYVDYPDNLSSDNGIKFRIYEWLVTEWQEISAEPNYITSFENPTLNINNLGAKLINGTINYGEKYSLIYNGESWDVVNTRIVTGSVTGYTNYTVYLPFTPDLVIGYNEHNNYTLVGGGSETQARGYHVPRVLTKGYLSEYGKIIENGFTYTGTNIGYAIYYIAIKF